MESKGYPDSAKESVAAEVRAWLARRQWSGRAASQELGWTEIYLNRRLRGVVPFDVADLEQLAKLLDLPITAFFQTPDVVRIGLGSGNLRFSTPLRRAA